VGAWDAFGQFDTDGLEGTAPEGVSTMKSLCKWKKDDYEDKFDELKDIVKGAKYVCLKCGRSAKTKKALCKPEPLGK
jgi:hypothetical protein